MSTPEKSRLMAAEALIYALSYEAYGWAGPAAYVATAFLMRLVWGLFPGSEP